MTRQANAARISSTTDSARRRLLVLTLAVIGIALYQAGMQMARRDVALGSDLLQVARFSQVGTYIVALVLFRNHLPSVRTLALGSIVLLTVACAGSVLPLFLPPLGVGEIFAVLTQVASGVAIGTTYLLFWHFLSTFEPHAGVTALFASQLLREAIFGSGAVWSQEAVFWIQVWGRLLGLALFAGALVLKERTPYPDDRPMQYGFLPAGEKPRRPLAFLTDNADFLFQALLAGLTTFIFGFTSALVSDPGMHNGHHGLVAEACAVACLAVILAAVWSRRLALTFNFFFLSTMTLYALGLVLLPPLWGAASPWASAPLRCGVAVYEAVLYALLITKAHDNPRFSYLYFAAFGVFANVNYGRAVEPLLVRGPVTQTTVWEVCTVFLFLLVMLCLLLFFLQRTRYASTAAAATGKEDAGSNAPSETVDPFTANVETLCKRYRLTAREQEVLLEVLHGYTAPNVAKRLGVAPGTIRTHLKNVYHKVGVTNKQELVHAIETL